MYTTSLRTRVIAVFLSILMLGGLVSPALAMTIAITETTSLFSTGVLCDEEGLVRVVYGEDAHLPEGASLAVREVEDTGTYLTAAEEMLGTGLRVVGSRFYEIEIIDAEGNSVQPAAPVGVTIIDPDAPEGAEANVFHYPANHPAAEDAAAEAEAPLDGEWKEALAPELPAEGVGRKSLMMSGEAFAAAVEDAPFAEEGTEETDPAFEEEILPIAEKIERAEQHDGEIYFIADGFSVYGIVYTVDFSFSVDGKTFEYSIAGGSGIGFSELLPILGVVSDDPETDEDEVLAFVDRVEAVAFSDPDLVWVGKAEEDTTVGRLKEENDLECVYSADLTEEDTAALDDVEIHAGDWALISLKAFDTEETLTLTMQDGQVLTILVTDLNENPLGLGGKSFKIVNNSRALMNTVNGTSTTYGRRFDSTTTLSSGTTWTFEYTGDGTNFLLKDSAGNYLLMIPSAVANSTQGLVQGLQTTTNRELAETYPIVAREMIDSNGNRGYCLMDSTATYALARDNSNRFYLDTARFENNKTDPKYCMELRDPSSTGKPGEVSTADTKADGITINLFDYYALENRWDPRYGSYTVDILDEEANTYNNNTGTVANGYDVGINQGHALKFMSHGTAPSNVGNVSINNWADPDLSSGNYVSIQGVVQSALGEDGYPLLSTNNESLAYLFDGEGIPNAKTAYTDVNHLFIKDEKGYYLYNSNENYAYYDTAQEGGGDFSVYAGTFNEEGSDNTKNEAVGFFPFDDYDAYYNCIHGGYPGRHGNFQYYGPHNGTDSDKIGHYNHQFGMSMEASFIMTPDGKYLGDDIVFNFSGDDDLWVFVDGVLLLDIGGVHNPVAGQINFNTGNISVYDEVHGKTSDEVTQLVVKGSQAGPNTIKEAFERVTGKEWNNDPYSRHKLQVFYMERGGMYSNLSINFNLPTYKTLTVEKKLEGLNEEQLEQYNDEYFYFQINTTYPTNSDTPIPYNGPYGVLTRPATEQETADWVEVYETIEGEQVYVGGHWREGTGHSENETINKEGKLVRWHIQVDNGMVRVKPGWIFTIEELAQGEKFNVTELYGCPRDSENPEAFHVFRDGEADPDEPDEDLMEPFFAPTAEYTYYYPEDTFHREALPLNENTVVGDRKAWRSETKDLKYSDWVYFRNTLPTELSVEKLWADAPEVDHTDDVVEYKIYRIPYQIVDDDDPENTTGKKRVDYPVEELVKTAEEAGPGKIYIATMEGYTGELTYDSNDPEQSWKELVTGLPRCGRYIPAGQTDPIEVLYEYYVTEESYFDGYKVLIEGGEITDPDDPDNGNYSYVIRNTPLSPTDQETHIDVEKEWRNANGIAADLDSHKNDSVVFRVTQNKYQAKVKLAENDERELYPIVINLVDEGGTAGNPRETDTKVVYVPKGASFTVTPYYNDPENRRPSEHVVSVGGIDVTSGVSPRTITYPGEGPSSTYYYPNPNNPPVSFTIENVDAAKEITLWLHAGYDEWVNLYDTNHPEVNYLDKTKPNAASGYHKWTCELSSNKNIIWDIDEMLEEVLSGAADLTVGTGDPNPPDPEVGYPSSYSYTMSLTSDSETGLPTVFVNGTAAPGDSVGDAETVWKGSIIHLPLYEYDEVDGSAYIYTYEITEAQIDGDVVTVSTVLGPENPPVSYNGQSSRYLVKWEKQSDGTMKFTNKEKEVTEVSADKKWVNPNGDEMTPLDGVHITFELFADGTATGKSVVLNGTTVAAQIAAIEADEEMTEEDKAAAIAQLTALTFGELTTAWKAEWKDLPKYVYSDADAHKIVYTVKETVEYPGFENQDPDGVSHGGTITNKQLTYPLKIVKVDAENREIPLSGATFQLTRKLAGETVFTKFVHDSFAVENGSKTGPFTVSSTEGIVLEGLYPGEYQIKEVTAPEGYLITLPIITFTLNAYGEVSLPDSNALVAVHHKDDDSPAGLEIGNTPGVELPSTGGRGSTASTFIFLGTVLTATATVGALLELKRRRRQTDN